MTTPAPELRPCVVKGCSWRGLDPDDCPFHTDDDGWDRQWLLMPEEYASKARTRHRR